jgi:hypothetical protein
MRLAEEIQYRAFLAGGPPGKGPGSGHYDHKKATGTTVAPTVTEKIPPKPSKELLTRIADEVRSELMPDRDAQNGDCEPVSLRIIDRLKTLGIKAYPIYGTFQGLPHMWVGTDSLWVDGTRDQFANENVDNPDQYFDTPIVVGKFDPNSGKKKK